MADDMEKTEEPTSKKIEEARKEGNVPNSRDTSGVFTLFVVILALLALGDYMQERVLNLVRHLFSLQGMSIDKTNLIDIAIVCMREFLLIVLPLAVIAAFAGVFGTVSQFGFNFTTKPLVPNFSKLNFITGLKNLISVQKLLEGLKVTLKSLFALGVGFYIFFDYIKELPTVALFDLHAQLAWVHEKEMILAFSILFILAVFAVFDFAMTRHQYTKKLRMSKQEVKDEMKNMEGDPQVKSKIRQIQMQMAQKRMMASVPEADVVITNPTHYAVAIKYDERHHVSPMVIAKGIDTVALKIKEIARENGVHIVENPPLARSLYAQVELDSPIPEDLYAAVAEVLAYVYKINKGGA